MSNFETKLRKITSKILDHGYQDGLNGIQDPTSECRAEAEIHIDQIKQLISETIGEDEHLMGVLGDDQYIEDIGTNKERERLRHAFNLKGE